ncbi:hypothetical protein L0U85_01820 [Glycomyces sp. L485]|uniref:hypothetical protein n=1 Tax=Glycomyces sp. L485 TaxID=2909235 RepID=UPI001F4A4FBB|nr:hypothetical protein [Glycomyces sp. L485]MCH7229605.1 hypothetical protein [Glycomyces sp. L485]
MQTLSTRGGKPPETEAERRRRMEAAFHVPAWGRCDCPRCTEAMRNGPICQSCHLAWPCPDAEVKDCGEFDR